ATALLNRKPTIVTPLARGILLISDRSPGNAFRASADGGEQLANLFVNLLGAIDCPADFLAQQLAVTLPQPVNGRAQRAVAQSEPPSEFCRRNFTLLAGEENPQFGKHLCFAGLGEFSFE